MTNVLFWTILYLGFLSTKLVWCNLNIETLEECEKQGKKFCYTGIVPDRHLINDVISNDPDLLKLYTYLKPSYDEINYYDRRKNRGAEIDRNKRDTSTDCTTVCCSVTDTTPPFSYFMDKDGWNQVASTPEFPMRVTFFTEKCSHPNSPCRGVRSTDEEFQAQCQQAEQKHAILLFNKTLGVTSRYVTVPSACKCRLLAKNPFKSSNSSTRRDRRNSLDNLNKVLKIDIEQLLRAEQMNKAGNDPLDDINGDEIL